MKIREMKIGDWIYGLSFSVALLSGITTLPFLFSSGSVDINEFRLIIIIFIASTVLTISLHKKYGDKK